MKTIFRIPFLSASSLLPVLVAFPALASIPSALVSEDMGKMNPESFLHTSHSDLRAKEIRDDDSYDLNLHNLQLNLLERDFFIVDSNLVDRDFNSADNSSTSLKQKLLDDHLNLINQLDEPEVKVEMLVNLARQYHQLNQSQKASEILNDALEVSESIENLSSKTLLLTKIAAAYIEIQEFEIALTILDEALEASQEITSKSTKAALLIDLASKYEELGELEKAETINTEIEILVAEIENPPPSFPFQPLPLSAKFRVGSNLSSSKNTFANFTIGIDASKKWARDEIDFYANFLNSYDNSRASGDENRIVLDVVSQYKHYFSEPTYYFANVAYLQDDFAGEQSRFTYFTGLGFNLWRGETEDETFDMQFGVGDLVQNSDIKNKSAPFPVFQYALIFKNKFFTDWKFRQFFIFEVPVRNTSNYFGNSRTVLSIPAINQWSVFTSLDLRYFGIPELDEPNLSVGFTAGLEYEF